MQSKYVENAAIDPELWKKGFDGRFSVESINWRDYHSKWHKAYWDLMFHRDSSYKLLLDLNHKQAARIMELEHDLRVARRTHE